MLILFTTYSSNCASVRCIKYVALIIQLIFHLISMISPKIIMQQTNNIHYACFAVDYLIINKHVL